MAKVPGDGLQTLSSAATRNQSRFPSLSLLTDLTSYNTHNLLVNECF